MSKTIKHYFVILFTLFLIFSTACEVFSNGASQDDAKAKSTTQPASDTTDPFVASIDKIYDSLLKEIITSDGLVRYDLFSNQRYKDKLNDVVNGYANAELKGSTNAQLAILCNAYNVHVIKQVLDRWEDDHKSVKDISGFFNKTRFVVAKTKMTLDDLENKFIRPKRDPRTHAALVCGAMGCPPLRNEPFTAEKLNDQLDSQCSKWINDQSKFTIKDQELGLSKIMKWYNKDFKIKPYSNAIDFVKNYADENSKMGKFLSSMTNKQIDTFYMDYDWNLNKAPIAK